VAEPLNGLKPHVHGLLPALAMVSTPRGAEAAPSVRAVPQAPASRPEVIRAAAIVTRLMTGGFPGPVSY